jgi:hypothetical protein
MDLCTCFIRFAKSKSFSPFFGFDPILLCFGRLYEIDDAFADLHVLAYKLNKRAVRAGSSNVSQPCDADRAAGGGADAGNLRPGHGTAEAQEAKGRGDHIAAAQQ